MKNGQGYAGRGRSSLRKGGSPRSPSRSATNLTSTGDRFSAGDLMMTTVLRMLRHTDIVTSEKPLATYIERCTARPAFKRALDAQLGDFRIAA